MKYTKEQRLDIGKNIYTREISVVQAAELYEVNLYTVQQKKEKEDLLRELVLLL